MFPTGILQIYTNKEVMQWSQSPQIGSMFPTPRVGRKNRLKTAQHVAIPSNRVNVSYAYKEIKELYEKKRRNPLKSGQCFLRRAISQLSQEAEGYCRNPLKSGQCFLQHPSFFTHYRKLNTPFAGTSLFLCFPFPYLTYLLP